MSTRHAEYIEVLRRNSANQLILAVVTANYYTIYIYRYIIYFLFLSPGHIIYILSSLFIAAAVVAQSFVRARLIFARVVHY